MNPNYRSPKPASIPPQSIPHRAFTLIELIVVLTLMGILFTLVAPSVLSSMEKTRGRRCGANLLLLENAKEAYLLDHPGQAITSTKLLMSYLKHGMPQCPSGGAYANLTNPVSPCSCTLNIQIAADAHDGIHDPGL